MTPFQVIPISNVNIRSGPGESFDIINKALVGTRLIASESQKDGGGTTWYKVTDDGWVNSSYVKQSNQIASNQMMRAFSLGGMASGLIQSVTSGSDLKIGDINLGVLGSLTGITTQSSQSVIMSRRIYGTPFQFLDSTDMRPDDGGPLGVEFCNNIMSETPILSVLPGVPNYLADLSKEDKLAKTKALTEILTSAVKDIQEMATEKLSNDPELDTKFFSFQSKTAEYMLYVNLLCRMCAIYLGIGESIVPGTSQKYAEFNWFNWHLSNAYANKSTEIGGAAEAVDNMIKFINDNKNITEYAKTLTDQYDKSKGGYGKIASSMNGISDEVSNNYYYQDTYYIDFFIKPPSYSESFSNSTGDSAFAGTLQGASNLQKELAFLFTGSGLGNANQISENSESFKEYMDKWIDANIRNEGTRKLMNRLVTGSTSVLSGANLIFPEIWNSSSYNRDFQVEMVFKTPYGDRESIFLNVMVPYMHALALVLPRQATVNSYTSPFLVRATVPGFFSCDMGIVKDMQVTKGGDAGDCWSAEGLPTEIRISMGIQDLYNSLAMSNFKTPKNIYNFLYNTALLDFIGVQCGLSMKTSEWQKKLNLIKGLTANIPSDAFDYIQTAAREEIAMSKARILAAK